MKMIFKINLELFILNTQSTLKLFLFKHLMVYHFIFHVLSLLISFKNFGANLM